MVRLLTVLLLLGSWAFAGERKIASFRLRTDPDSPARGYIAAWNQETFTFAEFGARSRSRTLRWQDLVPEDANKLRRELKLDLNEEEKLGVLEGHRLYFHGGGHEDGLLIRMDTHGNYLLQVKGMLLPFPTSRVERVEHPVKLREDAVYSKQETYRRALERRRPRTGAEHLEYANVLYDMGYFERAQEHYDRAIALGADVSSVGARLDELERLTRYRQVRLVLRKARSRSNLRGEHDEALEQLRAFAAAHPEHKRTIQIEQKRILAVKAEHKRREFHHRKHLEYDREIERFLYRNRQLEDARAFVTGELPNILRRRLMTDMDLSEDEYRALAEDRGTGGLHWSGYGGGSFIMNKRASIGQSTKNRIAGDPQSWWRRYYQVTARQHWLKAYGAERLPEFFEVVTVRLEPCGSCGGDGLSNYVSVKPANGGKHAWKQTCKRCYGARKDRLVGYR